MVYHVGLVQALTREGFDIRRHPLSLLSNGGLGWIQVTNFVVAGLMVTACAVGMRRVLRPGPAGTWGPLLVGGYGLGLVASGIFRPDPADGFPPGTPPGLPEAVSLHGLLHFASGGVAFLALIAACFVFARRFGKLGERGWAVYSAMTGWFSSSRSPASRRARVWRGSTWRSASPWCSPGHGSPGRRCGCCAKWQHVALVFENENDTVPSRTTGKGKVK